MALPTYQDAMLPVLRALANGQERHIGEIVNEVIQGFQLTEAEREQMLPSGQTTVIGSRIGWARTYLKKAGLIEKMTLHDRLQCGCLNNQRIRNKTYRFRLLCGGVVMTLDENPFSYVTDPDELSEKEREAYLGFWASRTPGKRLTEVYRLNRLKWGDEVFERGMDKSKIEVIDTVTGETVVILNSQK